MPFSTIGIYNVVDELGRPHQIEVFATWERISRGGSEWMDTPKLYDGRTNSRHWATPDGDAWIIHDPLHGDLRATGDPPPAVPQFAETPG